MTRARRWGPALALLVACRDPGAAAALVLEARPSETDPHAVRLRLEGAETAEVVCALAEGGGDAHRVAGGPDFVVRALLADATYACVATADGATSNTAEVTPPPLPDTLPLPSVVVPGDPATVGLHLVNLGRLGDPAADEYFVDEWLVVLDADGRPRWRREGAGGGGDIDATWLPEGAVLYGGDRGASSIPPTVRDLDGDLLFQAPDDAATAFEEPGSWHHDAGVSADGASVWALAVERIPDAERPEIDWEGFVVKRVDRATGETTWAWSASEDGVAGGLAPGSAANRQPHHANAVQDVEEADGTKLYVSLRNPSRVLKVDVATGAVDWSLGQGGDFVLLDADGAPAADDLWFYGQHDVKRVGDLLVVYDNGLYRAQHGGTAYSRALVLELDEDARTARIVTSWRDVRDGEDWYSPAWGGLDLHPDGALDLALGHWWWLSPDAPFRSALARLVPDGAGGADVAWRVEFDEPEIGLYRADRVDGCAAFGIEEYCAP